MYIKDSYGFWKQVDPKPFEYSEEYKYNQSTNIEMAYLRLGWLSFVLDSTKMKDMTIVDIGSGNGCFQKACAGRFKNAYGYDLCGESITRETLLSNEWDIIVLSDVLEHFEDINDLFDIKWKYCFLSYPETPKVESEAELSQWRHYKPDEHIWCLNKDGVVRWFSENNCQVIAISNFEDLIRKPADGLDVNITSMLVKKNKKKT